MTLDRKEAVRQFKEHVPRQGIYAIHCAVTNETWIGSSRNLDAQQNSTWFQLRGGSHRNAALQSAWKQHGEPTFSIEVLEMLPEDISPIVAAEQLKERRDAWTAEMKALKLG